MADIQTWIDMGKPITRAWSGSGYKDILPGAPDGGTWKCNVAKERAASNADREAWYRLKRGCRAGYEATEGLKYSRSAGGFVGTPKTVAAPDAVTIVAGTLPIKATTTTLAPVAPATSTATPTGLTPLGPAPVSTQGAANMTSIPVPSMADMGLLGGIGTTIGGPIGGIVGGILDPILGGIGGSRCPGPYNYDPVTGGCVPKSDFTARTGVSPCPTGYEWDGSRCIESGLGGAMGRFLPGGDTGTGTDVYGEAVVGSFGMPALVPYTEARPTRSCPPGAVLGKDNLCYMKGSIPNKFRKWPKPPRPALTAGDMKTIRRAKSLQNKVKRAAMNSGFTCKKR